MHESLIVEEFANAGYQISPDAVALIDSCPSPDNVVEQVLRSLDDSVLVVDKQHIMLDYGGGNGDGDGSDGAGAVSTRAASDSERKLPEKPPAKTPRIQPPVAPELPGVNILCDISNESTCVGEYTEFVRYFRDRYARLSGIIRTRITARPIESLRSERLRDYGNISIIGMVHDIRTTVNGNKLIELEDPTGMFSVLIRPTDHDLWEIASSIIRDEVIGVTGSLTRDGRLMIVSDLVMPEIPNQHNQRLPSSRTGNRNGTGAGGRHDSSHGKAVLISDVHIGSNTFLEDAFCEFIHWLGDGDIDSDRGADDRGNGADAGQVRYLIIAGDIVDGVGVYPGQEEELEIADVYDQYRCAAKYLRAVPKNVRIIIAPGNHDAVRLAEPQPALPENIRSMFRDDTVFTGNPALIEIEGVRILIYHGRSMDDLIATIPNMSYQRPAEVMVEMLRRRHIAPTYGGRVSIAPEITDHFVIDRIPHILHCGHVHTIGVDRYKGVTAINAGTWQSQTEFQKRVNLEPVPAHAAIVDLATLDTRMIRFA
ncbi:MAG: DNA-directed DNA polymerase II small subunit [Euryarchaeota archaeon]|nr:DNA-directed DNA polymerase II small subunit [Euryarchaeota archaeon]